MHRTDRQRWRSWPCVEQGEVHAPNATTWASNTGASAETCTYRLDRERSRIAQRCGSGWAAAKRAAQRAPRSSTAAPEQAMIS
jgi:hypothetical protein